LEFYQDAQKEPRIRLFAARQTVSVVKVDNKMFIERLGNGLRVVGECMPGYRSVSMGVWINAGSVYEMSTESGAAHFIEHMLFKGTKTRSASRIAEEMDAVGGNLNAFTSKECTCFYGRVLEKHLEVLSDMLADMLGNSLLAPADIEREKGVVCEEIAMVEDSPEDLVLDTAISGFYEGDPLERPILGTVKSVGSFTEETLRSYMKRLYTPDNMVVAAAGDFDKERLMAAVERSFTGAAREGAERNEFGFHKPGKRFAAIPKDIEQVHLCLCLNGFPKDTPENYAQLLFSNAFGGTMSSRLFQSIREESGLAYSVYSYPTAYKNSGFMTLYAGTGAENAVTVAEMMLKELDKVMREGLSKEELERAKNQLISSFLMAQESTSARSGAIGRAELMHGAHLTEEQVIERINAVTMDGIAAVLPTLCGTEDISVCAVGRVAGLEDRLHKLFIG
jgi:predicted Zn-dependent peptidase